MEKITTLITHPLFQRHVRQTEALEQERVFCRHGLAHLLDAARIAWIYTLEQGLADQLPRHLVYAAALLHDIGRGKQITDKIPHEEASAQLAGLILPDCGYTTAEIRQILTAINSHRQIPSEGAHPLSEIIYHADKHARPCWHCEAEPQCHWKDSKKNTTLIR